MVFMHPLLKGKCGGSIAVPIGGVGTATGSGICKYPVAATRGRVSRGDKTFGIDEHGLECTSDGVVSSVMWIFDCSPASH